MDVVHIRIPERLTGCGVWGQESISQSFVRHVLENKDGCCQALYRRLCVLCLRKVTDGAVQEVSQEAVG